MQDSFHHTSQSSGPCLSQFACPTPLSAPQQILWESMDQTFPVSFGKHGGEVFTKWKKRVNFETRHHHVELTFIQAPENAVLNAVRFETPQSR